MSFASETKNELSRIVPEKKCCMLAEIAGFMRLAGSIRLAGLGKFRIVMTTNNPAVARHYKTLIKKCLLFLKVRKFHSLLYIISRIYLQKMLF